MNPRTLLCTTATILVFGLASVAGSQSDQKAPEAGSAKHPAKSEQPKQQQKPQRKSPAQNRQQPPAAQNRQQPPAAQNRQQPPAAQNRQQPPAAQNRQQPPPARGRHEQPAPPVVHRQAPVQHQPQSQRPIVRRPQYPAPDRNPQQRPGEPLRSRYSSAPRQVNPAPIQTRPGVTRVEQRTVWPRYRAHSWNSQHRTWIQRGGYNGYRISRPQFSLYFGRPHRYHLSMFQVRILGEYPQFYTNGFWFTMLDPVPEYWRDDWYDRDYITIVEMDDGYYLLNEAYPQAQIAISVQLR
jgi:hypothetical protein